MYFDAMEEVGLLFHAADLKDSQLKGRTDWCGWSTVHTYCPGTQSGGWMLSPSGRCSKWFPVTLNLEDQQQVGFPCFLDLYPCSRNKLETFNNIDASDRMAAIDFSSLLNIVWGVGIQNMRPEIATLMG